MNVDELLKFTAERCTKYVRGIGERRVFPEAAAIEALSKLGGELPAEGESAQAVLALLDEIGSPATVATTGGRYFGFVNGATLPAVLAANWLAGAWDQNAGLRIETPVGAHLEEVCESWLRRIFDLPAGTGVGFVTGATMVNFTGLLAARHHVLEQAGWDVERDGLFDAPAITVVAGNEVHASVLRALSMLGLGRDRLVRVSTDGQGRMNPHEFPKVTGPAIVCIQAGNVNTGACDPASEICDAAHDAAAWVHVDGAFGLWAAADPERSYLVHGFNKADSWATDCHKWLNVPYDCGLLVCWNCLAWPRRHADQCFIVGNDR